MGEGGVVAKVGVLGSVAPHNLVFFLSRQSSRLQLDPQNLPDAPEMTQCNTRVGLGIGIRATSSATLEEEAAKRAAATSEHQVEIRWGGDSGEDRLRA